MLVKDFFFCTVGDVMKARDRAEGEGEGLAPHFFAKIENKFNKNNLTKITEPKIPPPLKNLPRDSRRNT